MSSGEDFCRKKVEAGVEELNRTGKDICIIDESGTRHPPGAPHSTLPYFGPEATKHGFYAIAVSVILREKPVEETTDYVLLSRKPQLLPEEIRSLIPNYKGNA